MIGEDDLGPPPPDDPVEALFDAYIARYPGVLDMFAREAAKLLDAGFKRYSADAILHAMRWAYHLAHGPTGKLMPDGTRQTFPNWDDHITRAFGDRLKLRDPRFEKFFITRRRTKR